MDSCCHLCTDSSFDFRLRTGEMSVLYLKQGASGIHEAYQGFDVFTSALRRGAICAAIGISSKKADGLSDFDDHTKVEKIRDPKYVREGARPSYFLVFIRKKDTLPVGACACTLHIVSIVVVVLLSCVQTARSEKHRR